MEGGIQNDYVYPVDPVNANDFNKYSIDGWEMIFNPTTKEVAHLQQTN